MLKLIIFQGYFLKNNNIPKIEMLSFIQKLVSNTEITEDKPTDPVAVKGSLQNTQITVNPNTDDPTHAWDLIKNKVNRTTVKPLSLETPIFENKVRFVCVSDTHSKTDNLSSAIPAGDIFIHAGDFTHGGSPKCVNKFSNFLQELDDKFKYKIVIAGNHELTFDKNCKHPRQGIFKDSDTRKLLKNCIYLEDSYVVLFGFKIYGSPWQPWFFDWAFNLKRGKDCLEKWNMIPDDTDVLISWLYNLR